MGPAYTPRVTASQEPGASALTGITSRAPRAGSRHAVVACDTADGRLRRMPAGPESDALLARLIEGLRSTDAAVREPGGLFLVILDRVSDLPDAVAVGERISRAYVDSSGADEDARLCCGVTLVELGESEASLVTRAHGALALAQDAGPGRIVSSPPL